jgi:hypothetical protein
LGVRFAVPTYSLNRRLSHLRWHVTLVMVLTLFKPGIVTAEAIRRVRDVGDAQIAQLINEGIHMSPTFRSLVEMIDATNGIVYVERGDCGHGARACLVLAIHVAGPSRILRVLVNVRRERRELIAAIGHELHHAADVLANPAVTTTEGMFFHWLNGRQSMSIPGRFETIEAVRAGMQIEDELRAEVARGPIP